MAKKTNDNTINFLYINNKDDNNKKKNIKKKTKNNNVPKKTVPKEEIIDLDNEIIIGLTPKPVQKQPKKENKQPAKKTNTKKTSNQVKQTKTTSNRPKQSQKSKVKVKVLKWTTLVVLIMGIVILLLLSPIFNVKQINVEGIQKLQREEIINLSQVQLNENTFKINVKETINKIQENPYVDTVSITRDLPSSIIITVKEREPEYIIEIANGNAYIDSKGYILEISTEKLLVPTITGYETSVENIIDFQNTKKLSDNDCTKLEVVSQIVEAAKNNSVLDYITSIDISDSNDIKLNLEGEKKVAYLGDGSNANLRILYLKKIVEEEKEKEGEAFINGDLNTLKPKPYFREKV